MKRSTFVRGLVAAFVLIRFWSGMAGWDLVRGETAGPGQDLIMVDCPDQLVFSRESNSRSGICLRLTQKEASCRVRGIVGGEHISYVGVRGLEGRRYQIVFTPVQGSPGYTVHWPERVYRVSESGSDTEIIGPLDTPGFILACSAHPFGEYRLFIHLLPGPN